jgi:hypothetical protein
MGIEARKIAAVEPSSYREFPKGNGGAEAARRSLPYLQSSVAISARVKTPAEGAVDEKIRLRGFPRYSALPR